MRITRPLILMVTALILAVVAAGVIRSARSPAGDFVTRSGANFQIGGKPFDFVGFNLYDAAASDIYACEPSARLSDRRLRDTLRRIHEDAGASVVRFWAYQPYTAAGTDFSGMDRFIHAAREAGLRVIPVLEDGPGNCSTGPRGVARSQAESGDWYSAGYRQPYGNAQLSYRDYVRVVAQHYRDEPTIMAWMMMNEAETQARTPSGQTVLRDFADDVAGVIRGVDRNHLITLGTQGNGAPGTSGPDFTAIYSSPRLDFAEVHDWATYGSDAEPMPGAVNGLLPGADSPPCQQTTAQIACSFAIARTLGKPLIVGEAGITATDAASRQRRAQELGAKLDAAFAAGASGYLVWQLNAVNTDGYAVAPGRDDPLAAVLAARAPRLAKMRS